MLQLFIGPFAVILSLSTSTGIFLHETKVDKLAVLAMANPIAAAQKVSGGSLLDSMPHTHSESGLLQSSSREFNTKSPGITPRRDKDEKYRLKKVSRGTHLFDSYHLPLDQVAI